MTITHQLVPTITHEQNPNRRTAKRRYGLEQLAQDTPFDGRVFPALEVSASHDPERKRYLITANRILVGQRFIRMVAFGADGAPAPRVVHTQRYAAKQLPALLFAYVNEAIEPDLQRWLAWAAGALEEAH